MDVWVSGSLPAGLQFNSAERRLSGTPTKAGKYRIELSVAVKNVPNRFVVVKVFEFEILGEG